VNKVYLEALSNTPCDIGAFVLENNVIDADGLSVNDVDPAATTAF
jgi:hypothetical protein